MRQSTTNVSTLECDPAWRQAVRRRLRIWYSRHGRDFPWRRTRDPYAVWISEIMLQQTTVAAVVPYYERFLEALPNVTALASAPDATVLRLWEGLGYYRRARNLHAAARRIVEDYGGEFPQTVEELRKLPGVGRYTAGAIVSFCFDEPAPIVEANTIRLFSRLIGYSDDPRGSAGQRRLWDFARAIVPSSRPGEFNHALMDLGATICRPRDPECDRCPLRKSCVASAEGREREIPHAAKRAQTTEVSEAYIVVARGRGRGRKFLVRQREDHERWAGLWDFPRCELPGSPTLPLSRNVWREIEPILQHQLGKQVGVRAEIGEPLTEIRHSVTRFRIRVICFDAMYRSGTPTGKARWLSLAELDDYPLSRSARRLMKTLGERSS